MILYFRHYRYYGRAEEQVPHDVTHVIVNEGVTVIRRLAFANCEYLVSVIMADSVIEIEYSAFFECPALFFVHVSCRLERIHRQAFYDCRSIKSIFLPQTTRMIDDHAFESCISMKVFACVHMQAEHFGKEVIWGCDDFLPEDLQYEYDDEAEDIVNEQSNTRINQWLARRRFERYPPLHLLCHEILVSAQMINDFIREYGAQSAHISDHNQMTALHIIAMNPHATSDAILSCYCANPEAAISRDIEGKNPMDYAVLYNNIGGLIEVVSALCMHHITSRGI